MNKKQQALSLVETFDWSELRKQYYTKVHNMNWSFSRANSFDCPYCWFQNYILGRRDEQDANCFADYGTLLHELSEKYVRDGLMVWDLMEEYENRFMFLPDFPPNAYVDLREKYYHEGIKYIEQMGVADNYNVVSVEEKVELNIEGYPFVGFIDLLLQDKSDGRYVVKDYKSKKEFKNKKELKEYARQLYLYAEFVKQKYGKYPKLLIFEHFRALKETPVIFKEKDCTEAKEWLVQRIQEISQTETFSVTTDDFFARYLCNFRSDGEHIQGAEYGLKDLLREVNE